MTDEEIRDAILDYFRVVFLNFGGDYLDETLEGTEDEDDYDRACELMTGATLNIEWSGEVSD